MQLLKLTQVFCTIGSMPIAPPINTTNQHHDTPPRYNTSALTLVEKGSSTGPRHGFRGRFDFPLVPNVHRMVHDVVQPRRDSPNRVLFVHRSSGTNPQDHRVDGTCLKKKKKRKKEKKKKRIRMSTTLIGQRTRFTITHVSTVVGWCWRASVVARGGCPLG